MLLRRCRDETSHPCNHFAPTLLAFRTHLLVQDISTIKRRSAAPFLFLLAIIVVVRMHIISNSSVRIHTQHITHCTVEPALPPYGYPMNLAFSSQIFEWVFGVTSKVETRAVACECGWSRSVLPARTREDRLDSNAYSVSLSLLPHLGRLQRPCLLQCRQRRPRSCRAPNLERRTGLPPCRMPARAQQWAGQEQGRGRRARRVRRKGCRLSAHQICPRAPR